MEHFRALFEDEKARKNKEKWKEYFLSDAFLSMQFSAEFAGQMLDYLREQDFVPANQLPPAFLFELVTAYALEPFMDEEDGLVRLLFEEIRFGDECVSPWRTQTTMTESAEAAAEIWNMQDGEWRARRGGRTIRKWEYRLRSRSFWDYIRICSEYEVFGGGQHDTDAFNRGNWFHIVTPPYKKPEYARMEREVCMLRLYEYFFRTRELPLSVCVWLWETYELEKLSEMEGRGYSKYYDGIREALLAQYPDLKRQAAQGQGAEENYSDWKRRLNSIMERYKFRGWIVKPEFTYSWTYAMSKPFISEAEEKELQELINDPVFQERRFDETMLSDLAYRWAEENTTWGMTRAFFDAYMDGLNSLEDEYDKKEYRIPARESGDKENADEENADQESFEDEEAIVMEKVIVLLERMKARLNYYERIPEYLITESYAYDCSMDSAEFWYYYLMTAFDICRTNAAVPAGYTSYIENGMVFECEKYLSGYIKTLYHPSMEWRRRFVGSDKTGRIEMPRSVEIPLCMERGGEGPDTVVRIEFYLHHIEFYRDEELWGHQGWLAFPELMQYAGADGEEKIFFLLLPRTIIDEEGRFNAYREIYKRLAKLPVDTFSMDFIAECLSLGNAMVRVMEHTSNMFFVENFSGYYMALLYDSGFALRRYTSFGWQMMQPWNGDYHAMEEMQKIALYGLNAMAPSGEDKGRGRIVVSGMSNTEKARQICALLKEKWKGKPLFDNNKNSRKKGMPEEVLKFQEEYDFLENNSLILCYGNEDSCHFEKTLYTGLFSAKEAAANDRVVIYREKNYKAGWLFHEWEAARLELAAGEGGDIWYNESVVKKRSAGSLAEVIEKHYRLDEVTALVYEKGV